MKKTLIALAVAGTFAAPAAFAASANVDFYGKFRISVDHLNNSVGWAVDDETSRIGFKGAEDLGGGMKAIYQFETGFNLGASDTGLTKGSITGTSSNGNPATTSPAALGAQRDTFVGLAGDFGTVLIGRHDTPYKMAGSADVFADTLADAQNTKPTGIIGAGGGGFDLRVNNAIAYVSPSFSGLTFVGAIVPGGQYSPAVGAYNANSLSNAYSLAGLYGNGPLSASLAFEEHGSSLMQNVVSGTSTTLAGMVGNEHSTKFNIGYTMDALKLGATYEDMRDLGGVSGVDSKNWLVSAAYGMGPITLAAQYGKRKENGGMNDIGTSTTTYDAAANLMGLTLGNVTETAVGVVYSLSKRTSTYVAYAHYGVSGDANGTNIYNSLGNNSVNAVSFGLNHDF